MWRIAILIMLSSLALTTWSQTMDDGALLLEVVAKQSHDLHTRDTLIVGDSVLVLCDTIWKIYPHPLCLPLMYVPPKLNMWDTMPDNLATEEAVRARARRYITQHCADLYVAVSDSNRLKNVKIGHLKTPRALVKDLETDRLERERALRDLNSPWRRELNLSLQITQNYATENWYQGSSNSFAMLASAKGYINYKSEKISWENNGEWRAGWSTVSGDSMRVINTTDDIFRLNSKFGFQVHDHWYVSAVGEFRTNFWNNWQKNTDKLSSAFLTPIRFTLGVGVDYKPIKGLSINVSPATYKMVYALKTDASKVNVTDYGIEEGERSLNELGSSLRLDWKWRPLREIEVEANFYFFTNYKRIETELELDVDFIINRYLSAKVMLHPRYDSTTEVTSEQKSKMQFKELISIGFSHTFR